jgi:hypothetical protein
VGFQSRRERWLWTVVALLLLLIYGSSYLVRILLDMLMERGWLAGTVSGVFAAVGTILVVLAARGRPGPREILLLAGGALAYGVILSRMSLPQERIHFVEYGLLGGVFFAALKERWSGRSWRLFSWRSPELWAVLLTAAAGWLDEGIQAVVPGRVYDLRDVVFNASAGVLLVGILAVRDLIRR